MEQTITRKEMEDGSILRRLKHIFLTEQNRQTLMPVLACLRDSELIVPVQITVSMEDAERIRSAESGEPTGTNDEAAFTPDLLQNDEGTFLPVFSAPQQIAPVYAQNFSLMRLTAVQCIHMLLAMEEATGLVLDAFTEPMLIPKESAELILKMKSRLAPEQ